MNFDDSLSESSTSESDEAQHISKKPCVAEPEVLSVTPKKTVLPDDYDATTGNTPPGWEGSWMEVNARVNCDRPRVPGHTSSTSIPPGPFYVDTP